VGDPAAGLFVDGAASVALADWYRLGWQVLDAVLERLGPDCGPTVIQLWPEHFDAATDVAVKRGGGRTNLGVSPGDGYRSEPYLYVGPWGPERPGSEGFWDAPFGATVGYDEVTGAPDPVAAGVAFMAEGLRRLALA
jgi:hypothetical protein